MNPATPRRAATTTGSSSAPRFLHYYFYILDPVMGPMSLCVGSYLPFTVNCFLNGHSYVAQELRRAGVRFRMEDNAILACADPDRLTAVADRLDERILQQRASYWASRLAPRFSPRERAACQLEYQWSVAQIEFARDVVFHRRARLHALFQRAVEIGVALGGTTQTRHLFGRRINRRYRGRLETVLERRDEGVPVLRAYYKSSYVKQYEKGDRLLRTETCLNDTYHLDIGRKLDNLPAIKQHLAGTTDRYLAQQAELLDSTVDRGALAALASPVTTGRRRVPGIKSTMTASSACSRACSTPVACSATGRRGNCTRTSWRATVSSRTTTRSVSSDTTWASSAPTAS